MLSKVVKKVGKSSSQNFQKVKSCHKISKKGWKKSSLCAFTCFCTLFSGFAHVFVLLPTFTCFCTLLCAFANFHMLLALLHTLLPAYVHFCICFCAHFFILSWVKAYLFRFKPTCTCFSTLLCAFAYSCIVSCNFVCFCILLHSFL